MKKTNLLIFILCLVFILIGCEKKEINEDKSDYLSKNILDPKEVKIETKDDTTKIDEEKSIKTEVRIEVPFADQAPYKDWGDPYQEACEETSIIMASEFLKGNSTEDLDKNYIDKEILDMVAYQEENYGGHFDLDAEKTLDLFKKYYGYQGGSIKNINSIDDIKKILSEDSIIIAPTYGQALENPHFTPPGPVYHMLVIKGYDEDNFITNDPGIWQGKDFTYSFDNLFDAIHDLPDSANAKKGFIKSHPELMRNTTKNVIVVAK